MKAWIDEHLRGRRSAEAGAALILGAGLLALPGFRAVVGSVWQAFFWGVVSAVRLLGEDATGTLWTGTLTLLKTALVVAPVIRCSRAWPIHRRFWVFPWFLVWSVTLPMLFAAVSTPAMWVVLAATAAAGLALAGQSYWRLTAFLPTIVAMEPARSHSPLGDALWTPDRLAPICAANEGARPEGFAPEMAVPRYYGVTAVRPDLMLVTGDRRSQWISLRPDGTGAFDIPSSLRGNLWAGSVCGDDVWLTKRGVLFRATRVEGPDGRATEEVTRFDMPDPADIDVELDFADAVCDPETGAVFASEVIRGGIRRLDPKTEARDRAQVGGLNVQIVRRRDGLFAGIDTNRLFVWDPRARRVVSERPAGISTLGIDVCLADDAVVVTDFAGRVRLFERTPSGDYVFSRGASLPAPRRVAFSPDCQVLVVTSGDDRTVTALRRDTMSVIGTYALGPGLRDLVFVGARTVAVADACMVTFLAVPPPT